MKFIHIADLHLGKTIYGMSMLEDQRVWVDGFIETIKAEAPDAIVIAGDVYDRSQPSDEAVALFDEFIDRLAQTGFPVLIAAGNHDSVYKLSVHRRILSRNGVTMSGALQAQLEKVTLNDEFGPVDFYMMPSIFPASVRKALGDEDIRDYTTACERLLAAQNIDDSRRNVLIAHQCVMANGVEPTRDNSETSVGGLTGIEYTAFDDFDYVALGHIHRDMSVGRPEVRYCGTPMCYHFNETKQGDKGALLVEMDGEGKVVTRKLKIDVVHHMRVLNDTFDHIKTELANAAPNTWFSVKITDRRDGPDEVAQLKAILYGYDGSRNCYLLEHDSDMRSYESTNGAKAENVHEKGIAELFTEFYRSKHDDDIPSENDEQLFLELERIVDSEYTDEKKLDEASVQKIIDLVIKQEANA